MSELVVLPKFSKLVNPPMKESKEDNFSTTFLLSLDKDINLKSISILMFVPALTLLSTKAKKVRSPIFK